MDLWGCVWGKGHSRVGKVEEKGKGCKKKKRPSRTSCAQNQCGKWENSGVFYKILNWKGDWSLEGGVNIYRIPPMGQC